MILRRIGLIWKVQFLKRERFRHLLFGRLIVNNKSKNPENLNIISHLVSDISKYGHLNEKCLYFYLLFRHVLTKIHRFWLQNGYAMHECLQ